ncbi:hypothetical protein SK128_007602, partial [Halocaridina rubra]
YGGDNEEIVKFLQMELLTTLYTELYTCSMAFRKSQRRSSNKYKESFQAKTLH